MLIVKMSNIMIKLKNYAINANNYLLPVVQNSNTDNTMVQSQIEELHTFTRYYINNMKIYLVIEIS